MIRIAQSVALSKKHTKYIRKVLNNVGNKAQRRIYVHTKKPFKIDTHTTESSVSFEDLLDMMDT